MAESIGCFDIACCCRFQARHPVFCGMPSLFQTDFACVLSVFQQRFKLPKINWTLVRGARPSNGLPRAVTKLFLVKDGHGATMAPYPGARTHEDICLLDG